MKLMFILIFFLVVALLTAYSLFKGLYFIDSRNWISKLWIILYLIGSVSFVLRMIYADSIDLTLAKALAIVGYNWLFFTLYFVFASLFVDFVRGLNYFFDFTPSVVVRNIHLVRQAIGGVIALAIVALMAVGHYNYYTHKVSRYPVVAGSGDRLLKIVMVSDLHLSSFIGVDDVRRFSKLIGDENPDLVVIAGDLSDRSLRPLKEMNLVEQLVAGVNPKYGIFAVPGNHDYYGGERDSLLEYYKSSGINLLSDSVLNIVDDVYIAGRDDVTNHSRASLSQLLKGLEQKKVILVDHQPHNLAEVAKSGVTMQLSGHTHNGQFWPGPLFVKKMFELPYGHKIVAKTHFIVSSGLGIWGPKIRLGSRSEVVSISMKY